MAQTRSFPQRCSVPPALHAWWERADAGSNPLQHPWTALGGYIFNEGLRPLRGGCASSSTYEIFLLHAASMRPWTIPPAPRPTCLEGPFCLHFYTHCPPPTPLRTRPSMPAPCIPSRFLPACSLLLFLSAGMTFSPTTNPAFLLASTLPFSQRVGSAKSGPTLQGPLTPAFAEFLSWGLLPLAPLLHLLACVMAALSHEAPMPMLPWTALDIRGTQPQCHVANSRMHMAAPLYCLSSSVY